MTSLNCSSPPEKGHRARKYLLTPCIWITACFRSYHQTGPIKAYEPRELVTTSVYSHVLSTLLLKTNHVFWVLDRSLLKQFITYSLCSIVYYIYQTSSYLDYNNSLNTQYNLIEHYLKQVRNSVFSTCFLQ